MDPRARKGLDKSTRVWFLCLCKHFAGCFEVRSEFCAPKSESFVNIKRETGAKRISGFLKIYQNLEESFSTQTRARDKWIRPSVCLAS